MRTLLTETMKVLKAAAEAAPGASLRELQAISNLPWRSIQRAKGRLLTAQLLHISGYRAVKNKYLELLTPGPGDNAERPAPKHPSRAARAVKRVRKQKATTARLAPVLPIPKPRIDPLTAFAFRKAA